MLHAHLRASMAASHAAYYFDSEQREAHLAQRDRARDGRWLRMPFHLFDAMRRIGAHILGLQQARHCR